VNLTRGLAITARIALYIYIYILLLKLRDSANMTEITLTSNGALSIAHLRAKAPPGVIAGDASELITIADEP
jgi:hypothetical protein